MTMNLGHSGGSARGGSTKQDRPTGGYTAVGVLGVGVARQPSVTNATQVILTCNIDVDDGEGVVTNVQIAPAGAGPWQTIATPQHNLAISGFGVGGTSNVRIPVTFEIPAGWFYRVIAPTLTGTLVVQNIVERTI